MARALLPAAFDFDLLMQALVYDAFVSVYSNLRMKLTASVMHRTHSPGKACPELAEGSARATQALHNEKTAPLRGAA